MGDHLCEWRIELFGGFKIGNAEKTITRLRTRKTEALLAYLILHPGRHARELLIERIWPDQTQQGGRNSLNVALFALRSLLNTPETQILLSDRGTIFLDTSCLQVDVREFETALGLTSHPFPESSSRSQLRQAITLYQGRLMPGYYEEWILAESQRLEDAYYQALQQLMAHLEADGLGEEAVSYGRRGLILDPLREEIHRDLMRLLAGLGQPSGALRQYKELEQLLQRQLGTQPSATTRALAHRIEADLAAPSTASPAISSLESYPPAAEPSSSASNSTLPNAPLASEKSSPELPEPALPPQWTRFFGREDELAALNQLLRHDNQRLITLCGRGGIGKTRLALESAQRLALHWNNQVWFVPLVGLSEANFLLDAISQALQLPPPRTSLLDQVVEALSSHPSLLILDNIEHLLPDATPVLQKLLSRVPALSILVTSRQELGLKAEYVLAVRPLKQPTLQEPSSKAQLSDASLQQLSQSESVQLFTDRAQTALPGFRLSRHNARPIIALCQHLEGLPLAIELAAAQAAQLNPSRMLARFESRLPHLDQQSPALGYQHGGLGASLHWSYSLLWPELQHFFAALGVFSNTWTAEAATAVTSSEAAFAQHSLEQLRDRSLIMQPVASRDQATQPRFQLLESLREFALDQLDQESKQELQSRHATYYLSLVEAARQVEATPQQDKPRFGWRDEQDNLRAALAWSLQNQPLQALHLTIALWRFWEIGGVFEEGRRWLAAALQANPTAPPSLRAKALVGAGKLAWFNGDFAQADFHLQNAAEAARAANDEETLATALLFLGNLNNYKCNYIEAEALLTEVLGMQRRFNNREGIAAALLHLSHCTQNLLKLEHARELLEESVAISRQLGDDATVIITLYFLGEVAIQQGDMERAKPPFREGLQIARATDDRVGISYVLFGLSWLEREKGNFEAAEQHMCEVANVVRDNGHGWGIPFVLEGIGYIKAAQGEFERAILLLGASESIREAMSMPIAVSYQAVHERHCTLLQNNLGNANFNSIWKRGRALKPEAAIALAMGE